MDASPDDDRWSISTTNTEDNRLKILFIPTSGPKGAGEYIRSLTIAQKLQQSLDEVDILFILNRHAKYLDDVPFPARLIDKTPTLSVDAVKAIIAEERPDLCVFDSSGRTSLFAHLKQHNIPVIYVSSRNTTRKKAFRFRWLKLIDQHWIVQPVFANGPLTLWEKTKLKLTGAHPPAFLQTVYPESEPDRRASLKRDIGLGDGPYLLFSSGGGGQRGNGPQPPDIFAQAAQTVAVKTGRQCVVLMGPNYPGEAPSLPGVITLKSVPNDHFIDLLHDAELAVTGGGSSLAQGIAEGKLLVCAPAAADQAERIAAADATGAIIAVPTDVDTISSAVLRLLDDNNTQADKREAIQALALSNGLLRVPTLVRQLLAHPHAQAQATRSEA